MIPNADIFESTNFYFKQALKLIIYSYYQIKEEKTKEQYSRKKIHQIIKKVQGKENAYFQLEDFLRNDLVDQYLKKLRHRFLLTHFSIEKGSDEVRQNVRTGIVDIRFKNISATTLDGSGFIFECKRLNKYAEYQKAYIEKGMKRFIKRQYYPESDMALAGMIAFVEVDRVAHKDGFEPVEKIADHLKRRINLSRDSLKTTYKFSSFCFDDDKYPQVGQFKYSYLSKHIRSGDNIEIAIHHLLLDYYDILVS